MGSFPIRDGEEGRTARRSDARIPALIVALPKDFPWGRMIGRYIERRVAAALETREAGYTSLLIAGLEATAAGTAGNVLATGAVEAATGIWARVLAALLA